MSSARVWIVLRAWIVDRCRLSLSVALSLAALSLVVGLGACRQEPPRVSGAVDFTEKRPGEVSTRTGRLDTSQAKSPARPTPSTPKAPSRNGPETQPVRVANAPAGRESGEEVAAVPPPTRAAGAGATGSSAGESAPPDVEGILARAERTYSALASLRARFHQTIDVPLLERHREGSGIWYQKGRGRFRMDFQDPPDDEIVADGTYLWLYYPSTNPKQVIRSELGEGGTRAGTADVLARILEEARTSYQATYAGREQVDGTPTHVISLRPLGRSPYRKVMVWIGVEDDMVRRFRIEEKNETVRTVTLSSLEPNAAVPDSIFHFVAPADADVFEG